MSLAWLSAASARAGELLYAFVIIKEKGGVREAKLLASERLGEAFASWVLYEEKITGNYPVVFKGPPGVYSDFYDREHKIEIQLDVIVYEHIKASALAFYYKDGQFHRLLISD